jgi:hypothetical protein
MKTLSRLLVTILLGLVISHNALANGKKDADALVPDPAIQEAISAVFGATSDAQFAARLEKLKAIAEKNPVGLVQQVILYSVKVKGEAGLAAFGLLGQLGIEEGEIVRAILPLFGTKDPALRECLSLLTGQIEGEERFDEPYFGAYEEFIRSEGEAPDELVLYLFKKSPGRALLLMMRVFGEKGLEARKPILWAEHIVSDSLWKQKHQFLKPDEVTPEAMEQLQKLSDRKEWWARLYVAAIIRAHTPFRTPEVIEKLQKDENALVRGMIAEFFPNNPKGK